MKVSLASLFVTLLLLPTAQGDGGVVIDPDSQLGPDNLDAYDLSWDLSIDANCDYELSFDWTHPSSYPIGTEELCQTGEIFPGDGRSYLFGRWAYERFPEWVKTVTGIDHLSIDWNPCGHPPTTFLVPHYDIHWYLVSPDYRRTEMLCEQVNKDVPVCIEEVAGNAPFFKVAQTAGGELINAPANFSTVPDDAVNLMGIHAMDRTSLPPLGQWNDPTYVLCIHNQQIVSWEVMLPFRFNTGDTNHNYELTDITYVNQQIKASPTSFALTYNAQTKRTTLILRAPANVCDIPETSAPTSPPSGGVGIVGMNTMHGMFVVVATLIASTMAFF